MNISKTIDVNVECDIVTKDVYLIVLESILKYILYQFQQIPVQIDILEKELNKTVLLADVEKVEFLEDNKIDDATDPRTFLRQKAQQRRAKIVQKMHERKRSRWLTKVELLVQNFKNIIKVLQLEIENGVVTSTAYVVGSTPFTPKFVFKINVPSNSDSQYFKANSHHSDLPNIKRKILMNLLRAFANNNEMSNFSSMHCPLSKFWTLFEKENSHLLGMNEENVCSDNVFPRPDFAIGPRTKIVEVFLKEKIQPIVEMELTPCVSENRSHDNGFVKPIVQKRNKRKESRSFTKLNIYNKNKSFKDLELNLDPLEDGVEFISSIGDVVTSGKPSTPCVKDYSVTREEINFRTNTLSSLQQTPLNRRGINYSSSTFATQSCRTPCGFEDYNTLMIETPVVSRNWSPTPSPVKRLAQSITDICFSPTTDKFEASPTADKFEALYKTWYQIDFALCGFKDIYLSRS